MVQGPVATNKEVERKKLAVKHFLFQEKENPRA